MDKLALVAVRALAWGFNVPFLTVLCLVIFLDTFGFVIQLMNAMSISAFMIEFTDASLHEIFAELCLVV